MPGGLSVLNVGAGDLRFSFDPSDPVERERAGRVVRDMLARGYVLFVEVGGELRKAVGFDPDACAYVVTDVPGDAGHPAPAPASPSAPAPPPDAPARRRGRPRKVLVPAADADATAVAPTAGG
jgi:hypothetical protein